MAKELGTRMLHFTCRYLAFAVLQWSRSPALIQSTHRNFAYSGGIGQRYRELLGGIWINSKRQGYSARFFYGKFFVNIIEAPGHHSWRRMSEIKRMTKLMASRSECSAKTCPSCAPKTITKLLCSKSKDQHPPKQEMEHVRTIPDIFKTNETTSIHNYGDTTLPTNWLWAAPKLYSNCIVAQNKCRMDSFLDQEL